MDVNEDGKLNKEEILAWIKKVDDQTYKTEAEQLFKKEDTDGDGFITFQEYWADSEGEGNEIEDVLVFISFLQCCLKS